MFFLRIVSLCFLASRKTAFLPPGETLYTPKPLEESISPTMTFQPVLTGMSCPCRLLGPSLSVRFILLESLMVHFPMDIWHAFPSSASVCPSVCVSFLSFFLHTVKQASNFPVGKCRHGTAVIRCNWIHEVIFFIWRCLQGRETLLCVVLSYNGSC